MEYLHPKWTDLCFSGAVGLAGNLIYRAGSYFGLW